MTLAVKMADARYDGYDEGLSIGLEQGAYQTKLETARSFLAEGLPPEIIARCTELPLDVVLALSE